MVCVTTLPCKILTTSSAEQLANSLIDNSPTPWKNLSLHCDLAPSVKIHLPLRKLLTITISHCYVKSLSLCNSRQKYTTNDGVENLPVIGPPRQCTLQLISDESSQLKIETTKWACTAVLRRPYFASVSGIFYNLTDNGRHRSLCGRVGSELVVFPCHEVPQVGRLVPNTSAGTWHRTLGLSAVSDDAAATSRLLSEVDVNVFRSSSDVKATSTFCYYLTSHFICL